MYVYLCVYICIYIYTHIHIYVCVYIYIFFKLLISWVQMQFNNLAFLPPPCLLFLIQYFTSFCFVYWLITLRNDFEFWKPYTPSFLSFLKRERKCLLKIMDQREKLDSHRGSYRKNGLGNLRRGFHSYQELTWLTSK